MHNPDPKRYVIRIRRGEPVLVDRQILRWRKHRYPKSEAKETYKDFRTRKYLERRKSLERLLEGSQTKDEPADSTLVAKLPNLFSDEE